MIKRVIVILAAILSASLISALPGPAAEPPDEPILRIESGMHTATTRRIATDAANRYLVTASQDKTVGVWDAATGNHIRILRPPIGTGAEGSMGAVAVTPDGKTVAAGGWTQFNQGSAKPAAEGHNIYLFELSTGKLKHRITGLPYPIRHLTFSQDGRYLAVCLAGSGVRLYRSSDYLLTGEDKNYEKQSLRADFDRMGRLVTSSFDGFIRLYSVEESGSLKLIARQKGKGGAQPFGISFSPSATDPSIAVSYYDLPAVDLISGKDLSHLHSLDTAGLKNGNLMTAIWSSEGYLYAGGTYRNGEPFPILKWTQPDRWWGKNKEIDVSTYIITDVLPLDKGKIAFAAQDGSFGVVNSADETVFVKSPCSADYRNSLDAFLISDDALTVQFAYESAGKAPATFSVLERELNTKPKTWGTKLKPAVVQSRGLDITGWRLTKTPKLNGKPLKILENETSVSLAIAPSGDRFLLGTDLRLRFYDRKGSELWVSLIPGLVREVNIAGNGKIAVAAFGDGTIRWYNMADGKELLAFFPHNDRKRWVAWTPEGFFDASQGGAELIGYHLNRGKDREAEFIPLDKVYNTFYRPDLVTAKLQGKDLAQFARNTQIDKILNVNTMAPKVRIITAAGESSDRDITLRAQICDMGGGIGDITLFINEMPVSIVSGDRGVKMVERQAGEERCYSFEHTVTLQRDRNAISLMACNKGNSIESDRDKVVITYRQGTEEKPDLHIFTMAIDKYRDGDLRLKYSINDAVEMAKSLEANSRHLFNAVHTYKLYDEEVTKEKLDIVFTDIGRKTKREDVFVLFVAGHGITNEKDGAYYYLPVNFRYTGDEAVMTQGVSMTDFRKYLANIQAMKSLLLLDTCNSGSFAEAISTRGILEKTAINKLTRAVGRATIVASSKNQVALEGYEGHGVFTYALLQALKGKAADKNGNITINGIATYVEELLPQLTYKKWGYEQIPQRTLHGMDFPIAVMK